MQKYRVLIHGENLLMQDEGAPKRFGFYTNVFVEGFTPADAESRAIDILRDDAHLRDISLNTAEDPLALVADEVDEMESFEGAPVPRQGFALYREASKDDVA